MLLFVVVVVVLCVVSSCLAVPCPTGRRRCVCCAVLGRCLRIMKKELPTTTTLQLLYPSDTFSGAPVASPLAGKKKGGVGVEEAVLPLTADGKPAGRVFIGLGTHQTTGTGFHVHCQVC